MKELACKDMTLSFSATMINEDGDLVSIVVNVEHNVETEPDPYITTDDDKGFYFGDVTVRVTELTYGIYRLVDSFNLILKPSAQYVSRIEDDSKALLNGDTSEAVTVTLMPPEESTLSPIDVSIIAKVETPGQNSVWGS